MQWSFYSAAILNEGTVLPTRMNYLLIDLRETLLKGEGDRVKWSDDISLSMLLARLMKKAF